MDSPGIHFSEDESTHHTAAAADNNNNNDSNDNNNGQCVVCYGSLLEELTVRELGGVSVTVPCGHVLHTECARMWMNRRRCCVVCRAPVQMLCLTFGLPSVNSCQPDDISTVTTDRQSSALILASRCRELDWELEREMLRTESDRLASQLSASQARLAIVESERQALLHKNSVMSGKLETVERRCAVLSRLIEKLRADNDKKALISSHLLDPTTAAGSEVPIKTTSENRIDHIQRPSSTGIKVKPLLSKDIVNQHNDNRRRFELHGMGTETIMADTPLRLKLARDSANDFSPDPMPLRKSMKTTKFISRPHAKQLPEP